MNTGVFKLATDAECTFNAATQQTCLLYKEVQQALLLPLMIMTWFACQKGLMVVNFGQ